MINLQSLVLFVISYFIIPRLTFLPRSVHSLLTIFGPFLLPRLVNLINTSRATSRSVPVRPTPHKVQRALNLLFLSAVVALVLSLPQFAPENIFVKTQSRLQIEPNVLFARLRMLRPLTEDDEILRSKISTNPRNKLLYLTYGPDTLINCIWCASNDGNDTQNYMLYSLPKIIAPHIYHLIVLGLATSSLVGSEGSRFRTHATIVGLGLAVIEAYFMQTYDITFNKRSKTLQDIDFVHWRVRFLRYIAFAIVDGIFGLVLWLTSTNRWLAKPESIAERLEMTTRKAEDTTNKLRALGLLSNSVNRDPQLRTVREMYWRTEGEYMAARVQEEEVMEQINAAVKSLDMQELENRIDQVSDTVLQGIDTLRVTSPGGQSGEVPPS
ncbi:hypothetical protein BU24DRAFT_165073 [Aaosphaeria arxii CBS 175.79]|uniref:Chorismate synthase protein n=1 Tax=Aaosphaeria arxii CBS 175.79 TaxID=1450172 RepID=A0A6A5XZ94_9PLEO|nr:uncharacterized protein BU24DRAFT_165073 [Aaosphaeria arxii CBS 175.79]KAF2018117.1 hypothetical protein BU24DRAFT_165073 [Aaosphaeria arxii CBS 175.79]